MSATKPKIVKILTSEEIEEMRSPNTSKTDALGIPESNSARYERVTREAKAKLSTDIEETTYETVEHIKNGEYVLATKDDKSLIGINLEDVKSREMRYIWAGRVPENKGIILQGMGGKGKSMVALSIAKCIANGCDWPDGAKNTMGPRKVIWMGSEDDIEDTVKPRLQALGVQNNIVIVPRVKSTDGTQRRLRIKEDIGLLHKALRDDPDVAAIIFDPITGFYGGIDGNSHKDVRPIMEGLAELCSRDKVTIFAIMHENRKKDVSALERVLGAGAVGQVFRQAFRFDDDKKNKGGFIMACSKTNFKVKGGLRYTIQDKEVKLDDGTVAKDIGMVVWGEAHELSADEVIAENKLAENDQFFNLGAQTGVEKAKALLMANMVPGERKALTELHRLAEENGFPDKSAWKTVQRASYELKMIRSKGAPPYYWTLPATEETLQAEEAKKQDAIAELVGEAI